MHKLAKFVKFSVILNYSNLEAIGRITYLENLSDLCKEQGHSLALNLGGTTKSIERNSIQIY